MASQGPRTLGTPSKPVVQAHLTLRPPPIAVSHHHGVLIPPLAVATAARGTGAPPGGSRYGRSAPPLSLASGAASAGRTAAVGGLRLEQRVA